MEKGFKLLKGWTKQGRGGGRRCSGIAIITCQVLPGVACKIVGHIWRGSQSFIELAIVATLWGI